MRGRTSHRIETDLKLAADTIVLVGRAITEIPVKLLVLLGWPM